MPLRQEHSLACVAYRLEWPEERRVRRTSTSSPPHSQQAGFLPHVHANHFLAPLLLPPILFLLSRWLCHPFSVSLKLWHACNSAAILALICVLASFLQGTIWSHQTSCAYLPQCPSCILPLALPATGKLSCIPLSLFRDIASVMLFSFLHLQFIFYFLFLCFYQMISIGIQICCCLF